MTGSSDSHRLEPPDSQQLESPGSHGLQSLDSASDQLELELCTDDLMIGGGVWPSYDRRQRRTEQFSSAAAAWPSWSASAASEINLPYPTLPVKLCGTTGLVD